MPVQKGDYDQRRRQQLGEFLRTRRARITPDELGLAPGPRRRTPGLRREEVAQLAGVGVTWYTWLEQGRPINASTQVLDAVSTVLRLGPAERWHLYRLAEVPGIPRAVSNDSVPDEVVAVVDALDPTPACVYSGKYDILACNSSFAALFPVLVKSTGIERNALWQMYASGYACPVIDEDVCEYMVAVLRVNYANHVGDPEWETFVAALCEASERFAEIWSAHHVADPGPPVTKAFECFGLGVVRVRSAGFPVPGAPELRMVAYLPESAADIALLARLRDREDAASSLPA